MKKMLCLAVAMLAVAASAEAPSFTPEQWQVLRAGQIVKKVANEGGTQSGSWSAGIFDYPPDLMWKVLISLELYDEYIERTTVSALIDEPSMKKVVACQSSDAEEIEKLMAGSKPGYTRKNGDGTWTVYSYQRNEFPWPLSDRWVLLEITHDDRIKKQTWRRLAGNIKEDYGSWRLYEAEGGKTLGVCEIHVDADIPATGPFVSFAMEVTLPDTYDAFKKMAQDMAKK